MPRASVSLCDGLKVVGVGPVYKERYLDFVCSDIEECRRGVENVPEDMTGESRKTVTGDVNKSKRDWEKGNRESVGHSGGADASLSFSLCESRLSPCMGDPVRACTAPTSYRLSLSIAV